MVFILVKQRKVIINSRNDISRLYAIIQNKNVLLDEIKYKISDFEYFKTSLEVFKFNKAIDIFMNKENEYYIVMEEKINNNIAYYFSGSAHKGLMNCPRILATIKDDHIWIDDIFAIDDRRGNGSQLLSYLINKTKEVENIKYINGELSSVDIKDFDKLEYFYKKNKFEVKFNESRTHGSIIMNL